MWKCPPPHPGEYRLVQSGLLLRLCIFLWAGTKTTAVPAPAPRPSGQGCVHSQMADFAISRSSVKAIGVPKVLHSTIAVLLWVGRFFPQALPLEGPAVLLNSFLRSPHFHCGGLGFDGSYSSPRADNRMWRVSWLRIFSTPLCIGTKAVKRHLTRHVPIWTRSSCLKWKNPPLLLLLLHHPSSSWSSGPCFESQFSSLSWEQPSLKAAHSRGKLETHKRWPRCTKGGVAGPLRPTRPQNLGLKPRNGIPKKSKGTPHFASHNSAYP